MRRIAVLLALIGFGPMGALSAGDYILRVERISVADPEIPAERRRPLTVEFHVQPGVPYRCDLTVGPETLCCLGQVRRLTNGQLWLTAKVACSNDDASIPDVGASVRLRVEPGQPIAAEWLDFDLGRAGSKSHIDPATREGVRFTLREAEKSIGESLRQEIGIDAVGDEPMENAGGAGPAVPADRTYTASLAARGYVDDREGDPKPPIDRIIFSLAIDTQVSRPFHARAWFDTRELLIAGRIVPPAEADKVEMRYARSFKEHLGAAPADWQSGSGTRTLPMDEETQIAEGRTRRTREIEGQQKVVRSKQLWQLIAAPADVDAY